MAWLLRALRYSFMVTGSLYAILMAIRLDGKESILSLLPVYLRQIWLMRCGVVLLYAFQARSLAVVSGFLAAHIVFIT